MCLALSNFSNVYFYHAVPWGYSPSWNRSQSLRSRRLFGHTALVVGRAERIGNVAGYKNSRPGSIDQTSKTVALTGDTCSRK